MTGGKSPPTRRRVLALLGTTVLAGCGGVLPEGSGDGPARLDAAELRSLADRPAPTVPETVPVGVEGSALDARADRVRELLSGVPTPLGPEEVPNGAIRERVASMRERAVEGLEAADGAESPYEAMTALRSAREGAGAQHAAWGAIDGGLTREALFADASTVRRGVLDFDDRWRYAGTDPVRTVLVSERIERGVERAIRETATDPRRLEVERENPITVGELGGDVEGARAALDDARYLYERYTASLAESADLGATVRSAAAAAVEALEARRGELPSFDPDDPSAAVGRGVEGTPAAWALRELHDDLGPGVVEDARSGGRPARAILLAQDELARSRAFASLHDRVADGERFAVRRPADVRALRSAAVRAIEGALSDATPTRLARRSVTDLATTIRHADRELAEHRDAVEARRIARDAARYLAVAATARAVPAATERVASLLENAQGSR